MKVEELVVLKKLYSAEGGSHQEDSGGDLGCKGAHLLGSWSLLEMKVEELVVLQKWASAAGGSHQEDSGGDWEYVDAPLEGQLMFPVLKKW